MRASPRKSKVAFIQTIVRISQEGEKKKSKGE